MDGMVGMDGGMHDMAGSGMAHDMHHDGDGGMDNMTGHDMMGHDMMGHDMTGHDMTGHGMHNMTTDMHMMMMMYFHFSNHVQNFLFRSWNINDIGELIGAVVFTIVLAVLYEGLKTLREYLMCVALQKGKKTKKEEKVELAMAEKGKNGDCNCQCSCQGSDTCSECKEMKGQWHALKHRTISMAMHIVQTLLHMLQVGLAYILMLIAMLFNVWLFLAVVIGSGIGYFIFAKAKHLSSPFRESHDHCH